MDAIRRNWKVGIGIAVGLLIGALLAGTGRSALAQSDGDGKGRPVSLAIFKDPDDINARAYGYVLFDSGRVEKRPLKGLAGN